MCNVKNNESDILKRTVDIDEKELIVWVEGETHDVNEENVYKKYKLKDYGKTWALTKEELE